MLVRGLTQAELQDCAETVDVSLCGYQGMRYVPPVATGKGFKFTLAPNGDTFRRLNHRLTRRVNAVCYHGHYAFMAEIFKVNPEAVIISTMARYNGIDDFLDLAQEVAYQEIGSRLEPRFFVDACLCDRGHPRTQYL